MSLCLFSFSPFSPFVPIGVNLISLPTVCRIEIMKIRTASLDSLPAEILQQIAIRVPSVSAISLLLVCRNIRRACDDGTVWRYFIECNERFPNGIPGTRRGKAWKKYVLADIQATRHEEMVEREDLRWLPMLMALNRTFVSNTSSKPQVGERLVG